jgi:hypothetical protein
VPSLNGLGLKKKIRVLNTNIKIFLRIAFETRDLGDQMDFKTAQIDRSIQKPVRFYELRKMMNNTRKILFLINKILQYNF